MRVWPKLASLLFLISLTFTQPMAAQAKKGFTLASSSFAAGAVIPQQYSCEGNDLSPALQWTGAPAKTVAFAIIMDDPDAPAGVWVHWVMWNLAPSAHSLSEGVARRDQLDDGSQQGRNSFGKVGYNGPCPPAGQTHRYFFRVYALDTKLTLSPDADRAQLDAAMQSHVLVKAEYMGTFHR